VAQARGLEVRWNPFSLKVLNVGLDEGDDAQAHVDGHRMGRVVEAARQRAGQEHVAALYTALGVRLHPAGRSDIDTIIA
ncbi:disulfide bond formation protein DsbA, partial [Micrococcus sp. SIMBA_144]